MIKPATDTFFENLISKRSHSAMQTVNIFSDEKSENNLKKIAFTTFGCKTNRYDTLTAIAGIDASKVQIVSEQESADVYIINTCTVTMTAEAEVRKVIRRHKKKNPFCKILLMGCMVNTRHESEQMFPHVDYVHDSLKKSDNAATAIARVLNDYSILSKQTFVSDFKNRSRAEINIQDGCNAKCSYCIIPKARGKAKSRSYEEVKKQIIIAAQYYHEIVLTGIHLGMYGKDFDDTQNLPSLLKWIEQETSLHRIRISSFEPMKLSDEIIDIITSSKKICPHLHIPLQSGSDRILHLMRRTYTTKHFAKKIEKLRKFCPEICIGTDIISGFPSESDQDHRQTIDFIRSLEINYIHSFPYSKRPLTVAANMEDHILDSVKHKRCKEIRELSEKNYSRYLDLQIGKQREVIWEQSKMPGFHSGTTENYITALLRQSSEILSPVSKVKVIEKYGDKIIVSHLDENQ